MGSCRPITPPLLVARGYERPLPTLEHHRCRHAFRSPTASGVSREHLTAVSQLPNALAVVLSWSPYNATRSSTRSSDSLASAWQRAAARSLSLGFRSSLEVVSCTSLRGRALILILTLTLTLTLLVLGRLGLFWHQGGAVAGGAVGAAVQVPAHSQHSCFQGRATASVFPILYVCARRALA
jgi:hypothetical protein